MFQQESPVMAQRVNLWMVLQCTKATKKWRRDRPQARPLVVTHPLLPTSLYYTNRQLFPLFAGMSVVIST